MEFVFPLIVATVFIPIFLFFNANERRAHEERMKELEIERLRWEARKAETMKEARK